MGMNFWGGCNPKKTEKNRKKPVPNLKFEVAFGFFRLFSVFSVFFGLFRFFVVLKRFFRSELRQEIPVIQKSCQLNEVLVGQELPNNILNAYKALQMSYKSYYYQKEPLNKKPLNQSKLAKMEKPKKTEKNQKKNRKNQSQI